VLPRQMMMGSLLAYIASSGGLGHDPDSSEGIGSCPARFQPMNANFGLLPPTTRLGTQSQFPDGIGLCPASKRLRGRDKRQAMAARALEAARGFALTAAENRA